MGEINDSAQVEVEEFEFELERSLRYLPRCDLTKFINHLELLIRGFPLGDVFEDYLLLKSLEKRIIEKRKTLEKELLPVINGSERQRVKDFHLIFGTPKKAFEYSVVSKRHVSKGDVEAIVKRYFFEELYLHNHLNRLIKKFGGKLKLRYRPDFTTSFSHYLF